MSDTIPDKSVKHGAAWLLASLASEQRGYTTVDANDERVQQAVQIAKDHAGDADCSIGPADILQAMHDHINMADAQAEAPEPEPEPEALPDDLPPVSEADQEVQPDPDQVQLQQQADALDWSHPPDASVPVPE